MSRVGRKPIQIPDGVLVTIEEASVTVKGPNATLTQVLNPKVKVQQSAGQLTVELASSDKQARALQGLTARLLSNLIVGVTEGFTKQLEIHGVGYRAQVQGRALVLNVGFSHPVHMEAPEGIELGVVKNVISIAGADKQQVGQFAAEVRSIRPPEPYKGKGIKYADELIRRKAGKAAKAVGAA